MLRGRKGIFYAIDSILAATLFILILGAIYSLLLQWGSPAYNESLLATLAHDTLATLDTNNTLSDAVLEDSVDQVDNFLATLPPNLCAAVVFRKVGEAPDLNLTFIGGITRIGCYNTTAPTVALARRTFVPQERPPHVAEVYLWYQ
jgi:hypothetical protein